MFYLDFYEDKESLGVFGSCSIEINLKFRFVENICHERQSTHIQKLEAMARLHNRLC